MKSVSRHHAIKRNRRKHSMAAYLQYLPRCRITSYDKAGTDHFWRQNQQMLCGPRVINIYFHMWEVTLKWKVWILGDSQLKQEWYWLRTRQMHNLRSSHRVDIFYVRIYYVFLIGGPQVFIFLVDTCNKDVLNDVYTTHWLLGKHY